MSLALTEDPRVRSKPGGYVVTKEAHVRGTCDAITTVALKRLNDPLCQQHPRGDGTILEQPYSMHVRYNALPGKRVEIHAVEVKFGSDAASPLIVFFDALERQGTMATETKHRYYLRTTDLSELEEVLLTREPVSGRAAS